MEIEFKTIDRFPDYRFGSDGSVWSRRRGDCSRMKCSIDKKGYASVTLHGKAYRLHRIILEAFRGPCPEGMEGCHGPDPTRTNNAIDNLRWDTPSGNVSECVSQGRHKSGYVGTNMRLTDEQVREVRALASAGVSRAEIATRLPVSVQMIGHIVAGRRRADVR